MLANLRLSLTKISSAAIVLLASTTAHSAYYFVAHPDDIELFMGAHAYEDLQSQAPTVLVSLTSGDAGSGEGYVTEVGLVNGYDESFGKVRLDAHINAIRFAAATNGTPLNKTRYGTEKVAGKLIDVAQINNKVWLYSLYLADGNGNGKGFKGTGYQSLERLFKGEIKSLRSFGTVNNTYTKQELLNVLQTIVLEHTKEVSPWINLQDDNVLDNPKDHSDHRYTSLFVQAALKSYHCFSYAKFVDYDTKRRPENLPEYKIRNKYAVWGALNAGLVDNGNPRTYNIDHNAWLSREYFRVIPATGMCYFSKPHKPAKPSKLSKKID